MSAGATQLQRPTALPGARDVIAAAPLTWAYLLALAATTGVLAVLDRANEDRLLDAMSTNLHQLGHVPVRVLLGSAFWTSGWAELALWGLLCAMVLAPLERRIGWRRTAAAFGAGHVGATLVVAAGLWIGLQLGTTNPSDVSARDVGASYGFLAVASLATYLLPRRWQRACLMSLIAYLCLSAIREHTFTDFGHLAAVAIGLACRPIVLRADARLT